MQSLAGQQHNIFIMYSTDLTKNGQDYFSQSSATDFSPKIVNVSDLCLKNIKFCSKLPHDKIG